MQCLKRHFLVAQMTPGQSDIFHHTGNTMMPLATNIALHDEANDRSCQGKRHHDADRSHDGSQYILCQKHCKNRMKKLIAF
jgi:hypothetical protein